MSKIYNDNAVIALATFVAASDILFILIAVPESLPERIRPASWGAPISWEQADPFNVSVKLNNLLLCCAPSVLLSVVELCQMSKML